jgi:hypothetical protein
MKISACNDIAYGGSPARYRHGMWEAGNKKTLFRDIEYIILMFNRLI